MGRVGDAVEAAQTSGLPHGRVPGHVHGQGRTTSVGPVVPLDQVAIMPRAERVEPRAWKLLPLGLRLCRERAPRVPGRSL